MSDYWLEEIKAKFIEMINLTTNNKTQFDVCIMKYDYHGETDGRNNLLLSDKEVGSHLFGGANKSIDKELISIYKMAGERKYVDGKWGRPSYSITIKKFDDNGNSNKYIGSIPKNIFRKEIKKLIEKERASK